MNIDRTLQELVAIPSVCGDIPQSERAVDYMDARLRALGLHVERFTDNGYPSLVASTRSSKRPKVLLYSHLDVVAAPSELFRLRLEDGKYYGRGVLDMKFAAAAYLHVLEGLQPMLDAYDIGVMITTDEENHGDYGAGLLTGKGYLADVVVMPDGVFVPTWQIETFAKGCWFAGITAVGISTHGSRPWEGDSASIKLIRGLNEITALFDDAQKPDTATLNIGILEGGKSINQVPAAAMATLDIRCPSEQVYQELRRGITGICDRYSLAVKDLRPWAGPTANDINHPLIQAFAKHITLQTGEVPTPFHANATTDCRFFNKMGVPCIITSPHGGEAHSNSEWLDASSYEQFKVILRDFLDDVAKIPKTAGISVDLSASVR